MTIANEAKIVVGEAFWKRFGFSQDFGTGFFGFAFYGADWSALGGIGFGGLRYGDNSYGEGYTIPGTYQRHKGRNGTTYARHRFSWSSNPRTVLQQANRMKMRDAVLAWQALTSDQKAKWKERALNRNMNGYNLFYSAFLKGRI